MGTKNLARTAIERGRVGAYKTERDDKKASRRTNEKSMRRKVLDDPEEADVADEKPIFVREYQTDNLRPLYRFLDKQLGKNWDKVYSMIKERFDIRTLQSYHIVIDHIVREVAPVGWVKGEVKYSWYMYYRDKQNRLQKVKNDHYLSWQSPDKVEPEKIKKFLNNRLVGQTGLDSFFWFIPTVKARLEWERDSKGNLGPVFYGSGGIIYPAFRQGAKLTDEEFNIFKSLAKWSREAICNASPVPYLGLYSDEDFGLSKKVKS